jgi:hypothetical protein
LRLAALIRSPPVEHVPTGFQQIDSDGRLRADRLVVLVENDHVPGRVGLDDQKIILAAPFASDDRVAMPLIVADQPHADQRVTIGIGDMTDDVGRSLWTTGTRMRRIRLGWQDW